jgi:hypothetical protein
MKLPEFTEKFKGKGNIDMVSNFLKPKPPTKMDT